MNLKSAIKIAVKVMVSLGSALWGLNTGADLIHKPEEDPQGKFKKNELLEIEKAIENGVLHIESPLAMIDISHEVYELLKIANRTPNALEKPLLRWNGKAYQVVNEKDLDRLILMAKRTITSMTET